MSKEYRPRNYDKMSPGVRNIAFEEKNKTRLNEISRKYAINQTSFHMNTLIIELIYQGKGLEQIKSIVTKKFPELTANMTKRKIPLHDGTEIDVLEAQIKEKIERFKKQGDIKLSRTELIY